MKVSYDDQADALYLSFSEASVARTDEVRSDLLLNFDSEGHIVGLEMLSVREQLGAKAIANLRAPQ